MNLLLPTAAPADDTFWTTAWPGFCGQPPLPPFAPEARDFLDAFSKAVLLDAGLRREPAFAALAHWARSGHIQEYKRQAAASAGRVRTARGVVLNLAPANVDTLFAYAWFTSLLCGNATVVRVSARSLPVIAPLLDVLGGLLAEPRFAPVRARTLLVSYEHDDALTARLSAACHARLIWGGDATVRTIRAQPLPATAAEVAFADRFSLAAFSAAHLNELEPTDLQQLAEDFGQDAFQFGQRGCASPRAVFLTGPEVDCRRASARFWSAVGSAATGLAAGFGEADGIARLSAAMAIASETPGARITHRPDSGRPPLVLHCPVWSRNIREQHDGAGLFIEQFLPDLPTLADRLGPRDQTLVAAGFSTADYVALVARLPARALDRIVPPGRALDFDPSAWDGQDLFRLLTREITLP